MVEAMLATKLQMRFYPKQQRVLIFLFHKINKANLRNED